ncbi:MFS transporter [Sphingomonas sp.]|uniref:MFS transporter n=1 Tax=Sphingomonas sp. TaxID=28214 RepID=UPI003CC649F6
MTVQAEAATSVVAQPDVTVAPIRRTAIFLPLFAPFGIANGYVAVTLAFLLGRAGVSTFAIATIIAASIWPQTWKLLWAPLVDTGGNPKLWYGAGALGVGATLLVMSTLPAAAGALPVLTALAVASSVASTFVSMSTEIFLTHGVVETMRGRASGWGQAGNLGGSGIGGGIGLILAQHIARPWVSGAVLAAICVACWGFVLMLPPLPRLRPAMPYWAQLRAVVGDVLAVARSRRGYLALAIMLLPIASAGVPWAAIAGEWHAGGDLVALVSGVVGGAVTAAGALAGGYLCDRMDVKRAYCLFGLLAGATAAMMVGAPRSPAAFVAGTLTYGLFVGGGYAAYSTVVLDAIGRRSAATNFNVMAAISNVPIAGMTSFDGWMHDRYGTAAMLYGELVLPAATIAAFALFAAATRPRA